MDIALQHINDDILERMQRHVTKQETYHLIKQFREEVPDIHLRTTFMVGYPGETEDDFEELKEFVLTIGNFYPIEIINADDFDLFAKII
ncbi:Ribosomal protein S12 methylthiotransferase RimO [termite gut metagenome]|uniref:Ribosomal protein S12 methylthiotransferase RimO n=1 Tax=termite gut metagenome TaxID=433724 RepID=A0A5J4PZ49_9ZZZZ